MKVRMKYPTPPTKPYAPYKPSEPPKEIEKQTKLGELTSQEDSSFTIQWFVDHINQNWPGIDPATVKFSMEINKHYGYYDDVSTSLDITFYTVSMIDNPIYSTLYKNYQVQLEKYHFDYKKYQDDLKRYKIDEITYKSDLETWTLENAKATVKRLEGKTKGKVK